MTDLLKRATTTKIKTAKKIGGAGIVARA